MSAPGGRVQPAFHRFQRVSSTSDVLRQLAREGHPEGTVVVAREQTGGRGRRGRGWVSPAGLGLYLSVLLRPTGLEAARVPRLTVLSAVAARRGILGATGLSAGIKWPNDLWMSGLKLGGILAEGSADSVVIGIGLNVGADLPKELEGRATSLSREKGRVVDSEPVLQEVTRQLLDLYRRWREQGFGSGVWDLLMEEYRQASILLGRPVRVITGRGKYGGLAQDVDEDGRLLVRVGPGDVRALSSADVSVRPDRPL